MKHSRKENQRNELKDEEFERKTERIANLIIVGVLWGVFIIVMVVGSIIYGATHKDKEQEWYDKYDESEIPNLQYIKTHCIDEESIPDNPTMDALSTTGDDNTYYDEFSNYIYSYFVNMKNGKVDNLYEIINNDALKERGYYLEKDEYKEYVEAVNSVYSSFTNVGVFLTDYQEYNDSYICTYVVAGKQYTESNVIYDYDNAIEFTITLYIQSDGSITMVPFNIIETSMYSSIYNLTKVNEKSE